MGHVAGWALGIVVVALTPSSAYAGEPCTSLLAVSEWEVDTPVATRGMAAEGDRVYVGDFYARRIKIYDATGFVGYFPPTPGPGTFFGHGVALDGQGHLYTSDYVGRTIFKYDLATGALVTSFSTSGNTIRLEYDTDRDILWVVNYNDPVIRGLDASTFQQVTSFTVSGLATTENKIIALDPDGNMWVANPAIASGAFLRLYDTTTGHLLEEHAFTPGYWAMATRIDDREILVQDAIPILDGAGEGVTYIETWHLAGDLCPPDADGDGVGDPEDQCPGTDASAPVDADGCSGVQAVEAACPDEAAFATHGAWVGCVAEAARAAVDAGLMSPREMADLISRAARGARR